MGQLSKNFILNEISSFWLLFMIVIFGGHLGNYLNLKIFPSRILALITSILVLFVSIRMGIRLFF